MTLSEIRAELVCIMFAKGFLSEQAARNRYEELRDQVGEKRIELAMKSMRKIKRGGRR